MGVKPIKEVKPGPKDKGKPPSKTAISRILGCIKTGGTVSAKHLRTKCGYSSSTVSLVVALLRKNGCISRKHDMGQGLGAEFTFIKGQ